MEINTFELTGAALDYAASKCAGHSFVHKENEYMLDGRIFQRGGASIERKYSTNPSEGLPILEREKILLSYDYDTETCEAEMYVDDELEMMKWGSGPTYLIAGFRCLVACKLGDVVEIPDELLS